MLVATPTAPCSRLSSGPEEGSDHLFLLPERALSMDTTQLREDLASLDFSVSHHSIRDDSILSARPSLAGRGTVWLSGAAPTVPSNNNSAAGDHNIGGAPEPPQRSSSAHRAKAMRPTMHWFACIGPSTAPENELLEKSNDKSTTYTPTTEISQLLLQGEDTSPWSRAPDSRKSSFSHSRDAGQHEQGRRDSTSDLAAAKDAAAAAAAQKEREERIKALKERQSEERQRKLDELKQQALAAQRFREQKEEERRRRIEELRQRDQERRSQVEERKRQLWEAEREKREQLIRKTQEREARLEAKRRNERSSIVFAFGSSTPRMLEPADTGGSFWGTRRATSTTNVMFSAGTPLTRRSSERELDLGSVTRKQRATSAHALDRKPGEDMKMSTSMYEVFHWDLSNPPPTSGKPPKPPPPLSLPPQSPPSFPKGRKSPIPKLVSKALSLPPQSPPPLSPVHSHPSYRLSAIIRGDEDIEDGSQNNSSSSRARKRTDLMPTIPSSRENSGTRSRHRSPGSIRTGDTTPAVSTSRPQSAMSQQSERSTSGSVQMRPRPPTRKPRPSSIAVTGVGVVNDATKTKTPATPDNKDRDSKAPVPRQRKGSAPIPAKLEVKKMPPIARKTTPKTTPLVSPAAETAPLIPAKEETILVTDEDQPEKQDAMKPEDSPVSTPTPPPTQIPITETVTQDQPIKSAPKSEQQPIKEVEVPQHINEELPECDMTASMIKRITTEEQAKAALAERRRLAREQAEREAELERLRKEEEERLDAVRARREEEEQRRAEEEQLRLLEEARKAESQRLQEAIEEAQRREAEEVLAREEEAKQRAEKEEQDKKAREEAEKLRKEMAERLKKEEEERQARRKRVEAIMSRTRKAGTPAGTPSKADGDEDSGKVSPIDDELLDSTCTNGSEDPLIGVINGNETQTEQRTNGEPLDTPVQQTNGHHVNNEQGSNIDDLLGLDLGGKSTSVVIDKGSSAAATPNILLDFESSATLQQENGANDLLS